MEAAMDLMRRMLPRHNEAALSALLTLLAHHSTDLLSQVLFDSEAAKEFILCEYNSDSYRSPRLNKYHPPLEDGPLPSAKLRKLEVKSNKVFTVYRDQYYEGGVSSMYMWEDENEGLVTCFLIKKDGSKAAHGRRGHLQEGAWEAEMSLNLSLEEGHLCNMGKMIEEMEGKLLNSLDQEDKRDGLHKRDAIPTSFLLKLEIFKQSSLCGGEGVL